MKKLYNAGYLFAYAWHKSKSLFFTTTAKSVFSSVLPLINIAGLGLVVDALVTGEQKATVVRLIVIYLSLNLGISVLSNILTLLDNMVMRRVADIIQLDYMNDCVYINYHYVQDGSVLNLKLKSMTAHPVWFFDDIGKLLNYIIQFTGITYIFASLSPMFILIIAATSAVSVLLTFRIQKLDFEFKNARVEEDRKLDYLYGTMSGYKFAKEVRLNNADDFISKKYDSILKAQLEKLKHFYNKNIGINILGTVVTIFQSAAMYFYFSYQVFTEQLGIAEYTVLLGTTTLLTSILLGFFDIIARIDKTLGCVELFREYKALVKTNSNISASNGLPYLPVDWSDIEIAFENVSFTYLGSEKPALKNINIKIKQGEKIGIVGLNGSGKTTLIKLLCRIYDPTEGRITLNGVDIKEIPHCEYIKRIGIVLQDYCLFAYSVRENIVFDKPFDEEKFRVSIEKSGLSSKLEALPEGADTSIFKELDNNGVEFSGGEGQKLALARAIYKNAGMLILDEPTSALDPIAEYELFSQLSEISKGKTTLFISHRLSSTKFCDRIFVLAELNGLTDRSIVEIGSHDELLKNGGFYAELFHAQAKYYEREDVV